jgi:hypothetical protein
MARFSLATTDRMTRVRRLGSTFARITAITIPVLVVISARYSQYSLAGFFDSRDVFASEPFSPAHAEWQYWFIVALLYLQLFVLGLIAIPWVHRQTLSHPFGLPMTLVAIGLVARYQHLPGVMLPVPAQVFWLVALGWAAAEARNARQRLVISVVAALGMWWALDSHATDVRTTLLVLALIWVPWLPSTRLLNRVAGVIAASTLATYLTHWQVVPVMHSHGFGNPVLTILACLVVGALYFRMAEWVIAWVAAWWRNPGGPVARPARPGPTTVTRRGRQRRPPGRPRWTHISDSSVPVGGGERRDG